jgi:hypothetical protein
LYLLRHLCNKNGIQLKIVFCHDSFWPTVAELRDLPLKELLLQVTLIGIFFYFYIDIPIKKVDARECFVATWYYLKRWIVSKTFSTVVARSWGPE